MDEQATTQQFSLKYRPKTYADIVGHIMVVQELQNRSKEGIFPQTMLFSGGYGQGKTTMAMITAKLLTCHNPVQHEDGHFEPCNECISCQDVNKESFSRSVKFKDCSTMGKEDVLKLQQEAGTGSMYSEDRNQVFILEEAQELSKAGLGAALKLLEKPRKGVYFILTTMTIGKIDKAIQSRCQHYQLKGVITNEIASHLFNVLDGENLVDTVPEEFLQPEGGIFLLAEAAQGSIRTAVQLLERCVFGGYWTKEKILANFDVIDQNNMKNILEKLLKGDKSVFSQIENIEDKQSFFWISWKNLVTALIFRESGYIKNSYQKRYVEPLIKYKNLDKLYTAFEQVYETGNFIHENHIMGKLVQFVTTPTLSKPDSRPVRKVRG